MGSTARSGLIFCARRSSWKSCYKILQTLSASNGRTNGSNTCAVCKMSEWLPTLAETRLTMREH
jgi:hypothetical protein